MAKLCALPRQSSTQTDLDHVCRLLLFIFRLFVDQLWVAGCHSRRQKEKRASNQTALDPPKKETRTEHKTKQQRQLEDDALPVHDVGQKVVVLQPVIDVDFVVVDGQRSRSDASFLYQLFQSTKSQYIFSIFLIFNRKKSGKEDGRDWR